MTLRLPHYLRALSSTIETCPSCPHGKALLTPFFDAELVGKYTDQASVLGYEPPIINNHGKVTHKKKIQRDTR
jgi:hypothetical protein